MAFVSKECFAVRWTFFFIFASINSFEAYTPLYLRQLGFSTAAIGLTLLPGMIASPLLMPFVGFLADRYRARKQIMYTSISFMVLVFAAHLLPLARHQSCHTSLVNYSIIHDNKTAADTDNRTHLESSFTSMAGNPPRIRLGNFLGERKPELDSVSYEHELRSGFRRFRRSPIWKDRFSKDSNESRPKVIDEPSLLLLVGVIVLRAMHDILKRMMTPMMNCAAITRTRAAGTTFGSYRCWGDIGGGLSALVIGILASNIAYDVCGVTEPGYFVLFVCAALQTSLSLLTRHWVAFQYLEHSVAGWTEIRKALFNRHLALLIFIAWFTGFCLAFQKLWEFWYIAYLSGGPVVLGVIGLVRQPFVAFWFLVSGILIKRFGEMRTVCLALFLYTLSFVVLSFIYTPWLVLVVDVLQTAAYAFSNAALVVHFEKSGSVAVSAVMLSVFDSMFYGFGQGSGGAVMGVLFNIVGPRTTLRCYCVAAAFVSAIFGAYVLRCEENFAKYEQVDNIASENEDGSE